MSDLLDLLDNREKATLIWIAIVAAALILLSPTIRRSLAESAVGIAQIVLSRPVLVILLGITSYVGLVLLVGSQVMPWTSEMTKDSITWLFGSALVIVFKTIASDRDPAYFRKLILAAVEFSLVLTFLVNFYNFSILIELALVPFVTGVAMMAAVAGTRDEFAQLKGALELVLVAIGLSLLLYAAVRVLGDISGFASAETARLFLLPTVLTFLFLPLVYVLALYTGYEDIFVRAKVSVRDDEAVRYLKRELILYCSVRLGRVNRFLRTYGRSLSLVNSKSDAVGMIEEFRAAEAA